MSDYQLPAPRSDLRWLAVDFDDTIAVSNWSVDNPTALPGAPITRTVLEIGRVVSLGWKIIVHTARPWDEYEIVESWLEYHGIPFHRIVCGKLLAYRYIDDRNSSLEGPWV